MKKLLLYLILTLSAISLPSYCHATVNSTTSKVVYVGDGVSSTFAFSFNIYKTSDLVVQEVLISTGAVTTLILNSGYTVATTHAVPSPGSITLLAGALSSSYQLVILRQLPITQLINISDPYYTTPAATWNEAHDRAAMIEQQLQEQNSRSVLQNATNSTTVTLPNAVDGQCLGWSGMSLQNLSCSGGGGGGSGYNPPIADSALQTITTASKVNASAIFSLPSMPSGAGLLPVANIPVGTTASKIVQLDSSAKLPVVDGSQLTNLPSGNLVQVKNTIVSTHTTGSTQIPLDNTIPQITEGVQVMSLAITPVNSGDKLKIDVVVNFGATVGGRDMIAALFQDSTANALAAAVQQAQGGNYPSQIVFTYFMTAGTTSATTFSVRIGQDSTGTWDFNGNQTAAVFGGVSASSITITETK